MFTEKGGKSRSVVRPRFNWIFILPELADILFLDKGVVY